MQPDIIILDDNEDIGSMMLSILQFAGHAATACTNRDQLFSCINTTLPRLIIMDMLLAGHDGREICAELKADGNTSHIPIIMISAHPDAGITCLKAGADDFLEKPFEVDSFLEKVNVLLK